MQDQEQQLPQAQQTLDEVRANIFSKKQFKRVSITLWGQSVEFQQPTLAQVLTLPSAATEDEVLLLTLLVSQTFVPGTDEKVFTKADLPALRDMPFDAELNHISSVIGELTGNVETAEKN